jgi:hypothetical protein
MWGTQVMNRSRGEAHIETSARLAQMVEHQTLNLVVEGSSPSLGVSFCAPGPRPRATFFCLPPPPPSPSCSVVFVFAVATTTGQSGGMSGGGSRKGAVHLHFCQPMLPVCTSPLLSDYATSLS